MKQPPITRDAWVIAAMFFGYGALLAWAMASRHTGSSAAQIDWPAWVQAVGSVGAILGAISIAGYERSVAKAETERRERLENNARYTRANRAIRRFKKIITKQATLTIGPSAGDLIHPIEPVGLPDAILDLEHDCHLMGAAGADCLNAIRCFEEAQELIKDSMIRKATSVSFFENIRLADEYCDNAIEKFTAYLIRARN